MASSNLPESALVHFPVWKNAAAWMMNDGMMHRMGAFLEATLSGYLARRGVSVGLLARQFAVNMPRLVHVIRPDSPEQQLLVVGHPARSYRVSVRQIEASCLVAQARDDKEPITLLSGVNAIATIDQHGHVRGTGEPAALTAPFLCDALVLDMKYGDTDPDQGRLMYLLRGWDRDPASTPKEIVGLAMREGRLQIA